MRFLVVRHNWFMDSDGWNLHEIEADTFADAEEKAFMIQAMHDSRFSKCGTYVLGEYMRPRKLTWMERLTGKLR